MKTESRRGSESLQLLGEIACLASAVSTLDLPKLLVRIVEVVRDVTGLTRGTISLFDYISQCVYVIKDGGNPKSLPIQEKPFLLSHLDLQGQSARLSRESAEADAPDLFKVPLITGAQKLGLLTILSSSGGISLGSKQKDVLVSLASFGGLAIERCRRDLDRFRLQEWLDSVAAVLAASRLPRASEDVDHLLQIVADNALRLAKADFVTLYEYFEERDDVRLPPTLAGLSFNESVLRGRSIAVEHKQSAIFRILRRTKPFYAETAPEQWVNEGLIDADAFADERSFFIREEVVSSVGIPLRIEKERVGVLFINYRRERSFSPEFREHLEFFANHAALSIGNARFFLRSKRYNSNLEALNQIGHEFSSALSRDIEQIGQLIHDQTHRVIPTKNFFLCLYDAEKNRYELPYIRDKFETREALLPRLHEGLTSMVCRTSRPLLATTEIKNQLFREGLARSVGRPAAVWLGAPLVVRDSVIGAIVVQDYEDESAFNKEHFQLLTAIASQAAIAIDNYRLLRNARRQLDELKALLDLSEAFGTGRSTSTQLLSSILDHVCKLVSCDGSLLLLLDPGKKLHLKVTAASKGLEAYIGRILQTDEGVSGRVVKGDPFIRNDYASWPSRSSLFAPPPQHVCGVPLKSRGEVIGVMTLSSDRKDRPFSEDEIAILQRFVGPAAIAVQNARDNSFKQALIHAGPNAIVAVDRKGRITEFNDEAVKLFGYRKEDLLGRSVARLYWGARSESRKVRGLLLRDGKIDEEEVFGRSVANEKIPISIGATLLTEENGDVVGCVAILEDLRIQSLRGRTQLLVDALREISAEEDLGKIIKAVVDSAVALLYADAGCLFLLEDDAFMVKYSYGHDQQLLQALKAGCANNRLGKLAASDPRHIVFLTEETEIGELRLLPDSNSSVLVPIRTESLLLAFLLIESRQTSHFKTDQILLEVLASQAAVSLNRVQLLRFRERTVENLLVSGNAIAIGQLAATFLHEAKNSLNGISLTVQSLQEDIGSEPNLKAKMDYLAQLSVIQSEVDRFDTLSRRLQKFTQQGLRPEKKEVYLNEIVTQSLLLLGGVLRGKSMKKQEQLDPSLDRPPKGRGGTPIQVDEDQIQQVLMNLILNAVAASFERQPLLVVTRNLVDHVEVRVTDHGSGIPLDVRKDLFRPFFTTRPEGVGLGLYLSRILVEENHGGTIEIVSSLPGKGTTFSVRLPKPKS
jgi:PAS domain S-box-containing protein